MCWPAAFDWARSDIGINPPPGTGYFIRGMPLGLSVNGFIGDASPLGEVFVATIDKSVVVYDPLSRAACPKRS